MGGFMGDIFKTQLVPPTARTAREVVQHSQRNDAGPDHALAMMGLRPEQVEAGRRPVARATTVGETDDYRAGSYGAQERPRAQAPGGRVQRGEFERS
eukprot:5816014-Pyramimonas_sp.AAC.1